jgi:excisionase family DNA binding protein
MTDRLLTAAEVADFLGVSIDTVLDWHEAGELPSYKVGRAVRFRREELDAWLESKRTPGRPRSGSALLDDPNAREGNAKPRQPDLSTRPG